MNDLTGGTHAAAFLARNSYIAKFLFCFVRLPKICRGIFNILAAEFPSTCKALRAIMGEFLFKEFFNLSPSRDKYVALLNITGSFFYRQRQRNVH